MPDIKDIINPGNEDEGNNADVYQSLEVYRQEHPMDVDTVIQLGLDICKILDRGNPHGEISTTGILVTDNWEFVFDEDAEPVAPNAPTDVYALGMLMYRLLNKGRLPFMPPVPQKVTKEEKDEAVRRCLSGEAFPIPVDGNQQITQVLQKACHPDRAQRYQTAGEMRTALDGIVLSGVRKNNRMQGQNVAETPGADRGQGQNTAAAPVETGQAVNKEKNKKNKKGKDGSGPEINVPSVPSVPKIGIQGLFFFLSAALAILGMVIQESMTVKSFEGLILYGYCGGQLVLLVLALRKQGFLKLLGAITILDMLYVVLYDGIFKSILDRFGIAAPDVYQPGYIAILLPIVLCLMYWFGRIGGGRIRIPKTRIFAVLMLLDSVFMGMLGLLNLNNTYWSLELYPYLSGAILLLFALLIMEGRTTGIGAKIFSFFNICTVLLLMGLDAFTEQAISLGVPVRTAQLILLGVTILFSVFTCGLGAEKDLFED